MDIANLGGNFVNTCGFNTEALVRRQRFTGKLEQNAFESRSFHELVASPSTGVIPKPRAFTGGARDLAERNHSWREIAAQKHGTKKGAPQGAKLFGLRLCRLRDRDGL